MADKVPGHHAQQSVDLQPKNDTFLGIMPSKVSGFGGGAQNARQNLHVPGHHAQLHIISKLMI